ncbi:MAG: RNA polymerase subunit sigma, partial [Bacteroidetes bacterium]|nr:RNA polymerase subunit sigma [Bacteroidota bacterium]
QDAGSKTVFEFHGNSRQLISMDTGKVYNIDEIDLDDLPPRCKETGEVLKPDFIFFGEGIQQDAYMNSVNAANKSEVCLVIGTTGEVMPACQIPIIAKQNNAKIIEVNVKPSNFTHTITDIYLEGKAQEIMDRLYQKLVKFA